MTRDTLITILLFVAGLVLAFLLFGAGARWKSRTMPRSSQLLPIRGSNKTLRRNLLA